MRDVDFVPIQMLVVVLIMQIDFLFFLAHFY